MLEGNDNHSDVGGEARVYFEETEVNEGATVDEGATVQGTKGKGVLEGARGMHRIGMEGSRDLMAQMLKKRYARHKLCVKSPLRLKRARGNMKRFPHQF